MTREIKFRAWRRDEQKMYNIATLSFMKNSDGTAVSRGCEGWFGDNHRDRFSLDEVTLMQFTGLLDKNGKEIYEGDILDSTIPAVVKYDEDTASFVAKTDIKFPLRKVGLYLILGDIYKNPELLTGLNNNV